MRYFFGLLIFLIVVVGCQPNRYPPRYDRDQYQPRYENPYQDRDECEPRRYDPRYDRDRYQEPRRYDRFDLPQRFVPQELLDRHNDLRRYNLRLKQTLALVAQRHAEWMAETEEFSHTGKNDTTPKQRAGHEWRFVAENIAYGYDNEEEVMEAWMDSYDHRKNILSTYYTDVGFGAARARDGTLYWCAVYGGE